MLQGWIERGSDPASITIVEPFQEAAEQARSQFGINAIGDAAELADDYSPDIVIFAVKPQGLDAIAPLYRRFAGAATVFMSIAAGKPIGFFEQALGDAAAIVRCMPKIGRAHV